VSSNHTLSRRQLVQLLGTGAMVILAGCSEGRDSGAPESTSEPENNETTDGDEQHTGEQVLEQYLSENRSGWVELEETSEQIAESPSSGFLAEHGDAFDFEAETITHQTGANEGTTYDIDTAYITVESRDKGWYTQIGYLDDSEWRDGKGFEGNRFRATAFAGGETEQSTLETLFESDITEYSDISSSFPSEYATLLDK
jgi:hypothetical protein